MAKGFEKDDKGALTQAIVAVYGKYGGDDQWVYVLNGFNEAGPQIKYNMIMGSFSKMVGKVTKPEYAQAGIAAIQAFGVQYKKFGIGPNIQTKLNEIKTDRTSLKDDASAKAADDASKAIDDAK